MWAAHPNQRIIRRGVLRNAFSLHNFQDGVHIGHNQETIGGMGDITTMLFPCYARAHAAKQLTQPPQVRQVRQMRQTSLEISHNSRSCRGGGGVDVGWGRLRRPGGNTRQRLHRPGGGTTDWNNVRRPRFVVESSMQQGWFRLVCSGILVLHYFWPFPAANQKRSN